MEETTSCQVRPYTDPIFLGSDLPAVEGGDQDQGEDEEEDGGDEHHEEGDLGLALILEGDGTPGRLWNRNGRLGMDQEVHLKKPGDKLMRILVHIIVCYCYLIGTDPRE